MFVCARPDGDILASRASGEGLYARDTRHLSELRLTIGGLSPVLLSSTMQSGHYAVINATNPTLRSPTWRCRRRRSMCAARY
jgi:glycogen debranching enzyme